MKRIGEICTAVALVVVLLTVGISVYGQTPPKVQATVSSNLIFAGARLKLNITVSGDFNKVSRPTLPNFKDFSLLNSTPSTSRSISYVNGVSKSSYTYSYYLEPKSPGKARIPAITIAVDGKKHITNPINITVKSRSQSTKAQSSKESAGVFLRMSISNRHPVTGEQLVANVDLYFKKGLEVRSYQPVPGWKAQGFWKETLKSKTRPPVSSTVINGIRYRTARLLQFALFPTKSGKLTLSPYKIQLVVREAARSNDPFSNFFGGYGNNQRQIKLQTDPVTIHVQALPESKKGEYIGAVGSFDIHRQIADTSVQTGESIEVKTTINGAGNIPLINKPTYKLPSGLEVYQPKENSHISRDHHLISGKKTYTEVAVARQPGQYKVPAQTLAYYNPKAKKFITKNLPAKVITVRRNPHALAAKTQPQSLSLQPVTGLASWKLLTTSSIYHYWWLWVGLGVPFAVWALAYWQKSYRNKMSRDRRFARSQKAVQVARERLDKALDYGQNGEIKAAYNALQKALGGFIGDRLGLPEAGLSIEQYVAALRDHGVDEELIKNVRMLLNKCATINYAPESSQDYLKSHVGLAESIIDKLKKEL